MRRGLLAAAAATMGLLTACSGQGGSGSATSSAPPAADPSRVSGSITVLTNRTDEISDGTLKNYAEQFNQLYPHVTVNFEGITDYEGETKIRMNTKNYGDVLLIPNNLPKSRYPTFFASLGSSADLSQKYSWTDYATVDDQVYGIANLGNAVGFVYNKDLWAQAGVTSWPTTPQQFLEDLTAIKSRTGATPYYTNYHDGWPMEKWTDGIGVPGCDAKATDTMAADPAPWAAGKDLGVLDGLLYDAVHQKLTEADPTTTDWEKSKGLLANGQIGAMFLGSWAIPQMQAAAKSAGKDPNSIAFMPFPQQTDGRFCTVVEPDYKYAVNVHSSHKDAARAWIDWFINKSGDAQAEQGISSVKGSALPTSLKPFEDQGVRLIPQAQDKADLVGKIDKAAETSLYAPDYRQHLVDVARGAAGGDLSSVLADQNKKWADAQKSSGS
ncbi:ABC transporter substrate-binding protein [Kitasatospora sp. NPDC006697]|uniref:ABC transporter substrate-binding protein n=1 Tax=Kitasatospora sp. NPDC006697 TaxID=3364020 RepID=UPI0036A95650